MLEVEGSSDLSVIRKNERPSLDVSGLLPMASGAHNVTSTSLGGLPRRYTALVDEVECGRCDGCLSNHMNSGFWDGWVELGGLRKLSKDDLESSLRADCPSADSNADSTCSL